MLYHLIVFVELLLHALSLDEVLLCALVQDDDLLPLLLHLSPGRLYLSLPRILVSQLLDVLFDVPLLLEKVFALPLQNEGFRFSFSDFEGVQRVLLV